MPILSKKALKELIAEGQIVRDPTRDPQDKSALETETASYDLRVGTIVWKDPESGEVKQIDYEKGRGSDQRFFTLQPGQMVVVITKEELVLPLNVCGTVYSRNRLQKENILALNAGHVDPGYDGPIIIRLINLSSLPWILKLGDAVFTSL